MALKLDELLRRGDVCFFCGSTHKADNESVCPECGSKRPSRPHVVAVQRAIRVGAIAVALISLLVAAPILYVLYLVVRTFDIVYGSLLLAIAIWAGIIAACVITPWFCMVWHPHGLFRRRWQRWFVAAYPWLLIAGLAMWVFLSWNGW